jgi:NADH-quinone oxidoreductase subunit N
VLYLLIQLFGELRVPPETIISPIDITLQGLYRFIVPEAMLVGVACILFLLATFKVPKSWAGWIALISLCVAAILHFYGPTTFEFHSPEKPELIVYGEKTVSPILVDDAGIANFVRIAAVLLGFLLVLMNWKEAEESRSFEYFACLLCIISGLSLVGRANDLILLWLALELLSIPTYVMLYLPNRDDTVNQEATTKYFLLSIFSSAILLFGFSYLYGVTGTTNISALISIFTHVVPGDLGTMAVIAAIMVLAGIGFRITAFPFHFYAPDVYQGAPSGVVAILATAPKLAGFVALLRLISTVGIPAEIAPNFAEKMVLLLWVLSAITMTAGNVLALLQTNFKRMLAYSGVAHSGYMLMGIAVLPSQIQTDQTFDGQYVVTSAQAILFYLIAYSAMTLGAFAVLACLESSGRKIDSIDDFGGLSETNPRLSLAMSIFLFSFIGLPMTAGFVGKFLLFMGVMGGTASLTLGYIFQLLAIVGAVNAAIAAFYYLRILGIMYLREPSQPAKNLAISPALVTVVLCVIVTIWFGVMPSSLLAVTP